MGCNDEENEKKNDASIFNTSTIRDQARLRAVAHSSGVSSGWLKAIPQPTLGLAFSPHELSLSIYGWVFLFSHCYHFVHVCLS